MMSDSVCLEELPPGPVLLPEGLRQTQNRHDDIERDNKKGRGVRFKLGTPNNPVEPSCSEEDVELYKVKYQLKTFTFIKFYVIRSGLKITKPLLQEFYSI
ncbi:unnamed protein product [Paramecium octaurelia]|uniref:Uncharacterized protein n=1 Tax=Paramecium octaurelia TaxID=43137 RepID=A0A8S1XPP8_PAROT|nr:unnamed protein product [Paramecium octaurelia]